MYTLHGKNTKANNDLWSVYKYGNILKFVYYKYGFNQKKKVENVNKNDISIINNEKLKNNISRAKSRIFELSMCNNFDYFCTFTQNKKLRNRFDLEAFRKDFSQFIRNKNKTREQKIYYLLIPEQHKNGAWHMHGLLSGLTENDLIKFKKSDYIPKRIKNMLEKGKDVFNWKSYQSKFGYFTCTKIDNINACSKYLTKYITKDMASNNIKLNKHLFYASQGLKGKEVIVKNSFATCPVKSWDFENDYIKTFEVLENENNIDLKCFTHVF
jgi:hypothetical protein